MTTNLEVDGFAIDIETLLDASDYGGTPNRNLDIRLARLNITQLVRDNLTPDSKKIFEEYQEQNDPCRG